MKTPEVSVITALHNKGAYVAETIRSVLAQTLPDWEMIVVENGSTERQTDLKSSGNSPIRRDPACGFAEMRTRCGAQFWAGAGNWQVDFVYWMRMICWPRIIWRSVSDFCATDIRLICWSGVGRNSPTVSQKEDHCAKPAGRGGYANDVANAAIAHAPWVLHAALINKALLRNAAPWLEHLDAFPYEDAAFWFPIVKHSTPAWAAGAGALYRLQTAESRNEIVSAERAIRGIIEAVTANVEHLKTAGGEPNSVQTGNLMRTFEAAYRMALGKHDRASAGLALEHARLWLKETTSAGANIKLRHRLGLRLFNLLRFRVI